MTPAIAQGAHESVLYGAEGAGSDEARALAPALDPASRLSSRRQPEIDTPAAKKLHVIVIDDVLCFRQVPITGARHADGAASHHAQAGEEDELNVHSCHAQRPCVQVVVAA